MAGLDHIINCQHPVVDNDFCLLCGLSVSGTGSHISAEENYSATHQRPSNSIGFDNDLKDLDLPTIIRQEVLRQLSGLKQICRMSNRARIIYAHVYMAYLANNIPFVPEKLEKALKIDPSNRGNVLKQISGISQRALPQSVGNYMSIPIVLVSPTPYLPDILKRLKMSEDHLVALNNLWEYARKGDPSLQEEKPQNVAIGLVQCYLNHYLSLNPSRFHDNFGITAQACKNCLNKVKVALYKYVEKYGSGNDARSD